MTWLDRILGRPLSSEESGKEELGLLTGVPVLGLDALSSTAYGPEAALAVLAAMGAAGLGYLPLVTLLIVGYLAVLYLSYRQTIAAYPDGGGAYVVAKDNLGRHAGVWAAVSLLIDYVLNVAVGISAGAGALVSAVPALQPYALGLCFFVLLMLAVVNLRGVRESGLTFVAPAILFVGCIGGALAWGLFRLWQTGGHPQPIVTPPGIPGGSAPRGLWLLLAAFASGLTAMTGVEAVSNGVPLFRKPAVPNAQRTLTVIVVAPALTLLLQWIRRHYETIRREVACPWRIEAPPAQPPVAIIPIDTWNRVAEKALRFGTLISSDVTALHISTENDDVQRLKELWARNVEAPARDANATAPRLEIVCSPYRWVYQPILDFVRKTRQEKAGRLIAVVIPHLVEAHWYEVLLHNWHTAGLRTRLLMQRDQYTVVITAPWYLHERKVKEDMR